MRAIDRISAHDWVGAREALKEAEDPLAAPLTHLVAVLEERERERSQSAAGIRHEIANAASILQANLEGMLDGLLEPTRERLEALHESLTGITSLLDRWRDLRY